MLFFKNTQNTIYAVATEATLSKADLDKLKWLFGNAEQLTRETLEGTFVGPRATMVTPWSTNAVEITQNMDILGINRIEEFQEVAADFTDFDPMLLQKYEGLGQDIFTIHTAISKAS